jgi:peptidoglycan/xylan/chitin deacetylase (PgdA/CDA1 family)
MATHAKIKLVQCWDDGVLDDIPLVEILRKHRAAASFNLNLGLHRHERYCGPKKFKDVKDVYKLALPELKEVYEGFTVANHTLRHPFLTRIPIEQARQEIEEGRDALEELFGYRVDGFAYPYGDQNAEIRDLVRSAGHVYARAVTTTRSVFPPEDPMDFKPSCHFLAGNFWDEFEAARASHGVFYFWGHSYEIVTEEDWRAFDEKIERLSAEGEWISLPSLFGKT